MWPKRSHKGASREAHRVEKRCGPLHKADTQPLETRHTPDRRNITRSFVKPGIMKVPLAKNHRRASHTASCGICAMRPCAAESPGYRSPFIPRCSLSRLGTRFARASSVTPAMSMSWALASKLCCASPAVDTMPTVDHLLQDQYAPHCRLWGPHLHSSASSLSLPLPQCVPVSLVQSARTNPEIIGPTERGNAAPRTNGHHGAAMKSTG